MDLTSIRAKGVQPLTSERASLPGWELLFNVAHYFRHEGGVGNIRETGQFHDRVQGVVHLCEDDDLPRMDAVEAYGVGYDRIVVQVETDREIIPANVYIGISSFIDDNCRPTQRYMNILINGAQNAKLEEVYINKLRNYPTHVKNDYPVFEHPDGAVRIFNSQILAEHPNYTAVAGAVFDMEGARWQHQHLKGLFGGKDMTFWHLQRLDSSDGSETLDDLRQDNLHDKQRHYLNEYLHEYNREYSYVGRFEY
jgi:hypothetical protein